jgi:hypothetical protein
MLPTTSLLQLALCLSSVGQLAAATPGKLPGYADLVARQDKACMFTPRNIPVAGTWERTELTYININSGHQQCRQRY